MFVLLDQTQEMRSYEAVFGDLDGRRLVCIKRHLIKAFWKDGYYFCTYKPNYEGQKPMAERDIENKRVYPFSYLQVNPMKGRFFYRCFDNQEGLGPPKLRADNPWLGFMVVCCTPMVRTGKWTAAFRRKSAATPTIYVDQWRNCVDVGPGNDLLAALCMAYVFDRYQCQPLITVFGLEGDDDLEADDKSIDSQEDLEQQQGTVQLDNMPEYQDHPALNADARRKNSHRKIEDTQPDHPIVDDYGNPSHPVDNIGDEDNDEFGNPTKPQPPSAYDEFGRPVKLQPTAAVNDEFENPTHPTTYDKSAYDPNLFREQHDPPPHQHQTDSSSGHSSHPTTYDSSVDDPDLLREQHYPPPRQHHRDRSGDSHVEPNTYSRDPPSVFEDPDLLRDYEQAPHTAPSNDRENSFSAHQEQGRYDDDVASEPKIV